MRGTRLGSNGQRRGTSPAAWVQAGGSRVVGAARSLPGKLLIFSVLFVLVAEVMIFFPSASNFRTEWLTSRAESAHLAALAAETADAGGLNEDQVRELLAGADAIAVARVYGGFNELVLGGDVGNSAIVDANLTSETLIQRHLALWGTVFAPDGRYLRIVAAPRTRPEEQISVIVPEAGLRDDLLAFSVRIAGLSLFIAGVTGALLYLVLMFMFVRPIAVWRWQSPPSSRTQAIPPWALRRPGGATRSARPRPRWPRCRMRCVRPSASAIVSQRWAGRWRASIMT